MMKRGFLRESINFEFFTYYGVNNRDALVKPEISYKYVDELEFSAGANIFYGSEGKFGQYDKNDLIYASAKLSF